MLKNKIHDAFDELKAEDDLKDSTLSYLRQYDQKKPRKPFLRPKMALAFVCILMLISIGGVSYHAYFSPASYIDLDINPSIEITINKFGKVIDTYAYNDDGTELLNSIDIKYKSYDDALVLLIDAIEEEGYFTNSELLSLTIQTDKNEDSLLGNIKSQLNTILDSKNANLEQEVFAVDADIRTHAHKSGVSPAKYLAILELMEVDASVTMEACQHHSISELREYTEQHSQNHHGKKNRNRHHGH